MVIKSKQQLKQKDAAKHKKKEELLKKKHNLDDGKNMKLNIR